MRRSGFVTLLALCISSFGFNSESLDTPEDNLSTQIRRFVPTELASNVAPLSRGDRITLNRIIDAERLIDSVYLRQVWSGNVALARKLKNDTSRLGRLRFHYFNINVGPWSRIDGNRPFIEGVPGKPKQAGFYPDDMTREEFLDWLGTLPEAERTRATGPLSSVRRGPGGKLSISSYNAEYREFLEPAAALLSEGSELTNDPGLKEFLRTRAAALLSNDYRESDAALAELDTLIELNIGPLERHDDELFGRKASFGGFVGLRDDSETRRLERIGGYVQDVLDYLSDDCRCNASKSGRAAKVRAADLLYASGALNRGFQESILDVAPSEVRRGKVVKILVLKNLQEAQFHEVLVPLSRVVVDASQQRNVTFESFVTLILAEHLSRIAASSIMRAQDDNTEARLDYAPIEEAHSTLTGLYAVQCLIDRGILGREVEQTIYPTYLAEVVRSMRFGLAHPHAAGAALQFRFLSDEGVILMKEDTRTLMINRDRIKPAVCKLARRLRDVAQDDPERAGLFVQRHVSLNPSMLKTLDKLNRVPLEIEPIFLLAKSPRGRFKLD